MKKLIFVSILLASVALNATVIIAHRGENRLAPENSVEAANIAWKNGVKFVEADFWEISTGEIICMHAIGELKKYACIDKDIKKLTIDEVKTLNLAKGEKWKGKFDVVKVPTLQEIMATIPSDGTLVLEVKHYSDTFAKKVDDARKSIGLRKDQVIIIAFDANVIKSFNSKIKGYKTLWLYALEMQNGKLNYTPEEAIAVCKEIGASGVDVGVTSLLGQHYINEVRKAGLDFYVWTINTDHELRRMKRLNVDGITTDTATIAMALMKKIEKEIANKKATKR